MILSDFAQIFINFGDIEMIVAELDCIRGEYWHVRAESRFKCAVAVDIDDFELERDVGLQRAQARDHLVT